MASRSLFSSRTLRGSAARAWYRIIAAGAVCVVGLGAWALYVHAEARRQALLDAGRSAAVVAQAVSRDEERLVDTAQQILLGLSRRPEILAGGPGACADVMAGVVRSVPGYLNLVVVNPRGGIVCSAGTAARLPGNADPADVQRALQSGSPALGRLGIDTATRRPTLAVTVPAVDDDGVVRAAVVAALDLGVLMRPAMESPLPAGSALLLVDAAGVVLAHHPDPERWIGEILDERLGTIAADQGAGLVAAADLAGTPALVLSEPLFRDPTRAREASVVITLPRRAVVRDADRLFSLELAGLGLLTLGGLVVSALVLDRAVARPAHGMLRVIRSLNAGDTRARMRRGDEDRSMVGHIARSLNALGRRLEEHQQTTQHLEAQLRDARAMQVVSALAPAPAEPAAPAMPAPPPPAEVEMPADAEPLPHSGFREPPFENAPNPKFLWLSPSHSDALVRLTYALRQRRGCGLLTGEPGCGKTLITRAVVQRLEPKRYEIALLTNPHGGRTDLLRQVLYELGVDTAEPTRAELVHLLHDLVVRNFRRGRETLVIVDDAQEVDDPEWFEELSSLLNIQTNERTLVTLLLVGTPDLTDKVECVRHLDRRVSLRCTLGPLDTEQTGRYIRYRLGVAGGDESMFTPEAIAIVHAATRGVPRAINDLCDSALLLAHLDRRTSVDETLMRRVLSDTPTYVGAPDGPHTP